MDPKRKETAVVIAAHGAPATDYPPMRVGLLMMLEFADKMTERIGFLRRWRERLDAEVRAWQRTPDNDPYKLAVDDLAARLSARLGCPVIGAYNEFCAPTIEEAIDQVVADGARTVVVVPTMLLGGNKHTESEIHQAILQARQRHPTVTIHYTWRFDPKVLVSVLAGVVERALAP